ncbi:MAG: hypothetical protein PVJ09_04365 [Candidatus Woesebacteria bacterium]
MKKSFFIFTMLVLMSMSLSACTKSAPDSSGGAGSEQGSAPAASEKKGDTSKTGRIGGAEGNYFLTEADQSIVQIKSYSIDLGQYVGQTVTITGQYSGDELFVGKVE